MPTPFAPIDVPPIDSPIICERVKLGHGTPVLAGSYDVVRLEVIASHIKDIVHIGVGPDSHLFDRSPRTGVVHNVLSRKVALP